MRFRVSCFLLLLALSLWLPARQKPKPDFEFCSSPVLLENQGIYPLALQYRNQLSRLVESWAFFSVLSGGLDHLSARTNSTPAFCEVAVRPVPCSDPCYGLMSLQL
jgi:hypothetical protein